MPTTRPYLLAIDTAGSRALLALGDPDGTLVAEARWAAGFRHGEELLVRLQALLDENRIGLDSIAAVVAGTGPGAFTGLRVGLATAKALATGLSVPLVGVPTAEALLGAVGEALSDAGPFALLLPAGPSDRVVVAPNGRSPNDGPGQPAARIVRAGDDPELEGRVPVAVDLDGRADVDALERGRLAEDGLARSLLRLGARRLAETGGDDVARLVPEYVTLPRGVPEVAGEVKWSRTR